MTKPITMVRCDLHGTLLIGGHVCSLCQKEEKIIEKQAAEGKPEAERMKPGALGTMRRERVEHE